MFIDNMVKEDFGEVKVPMESTMEPRSIEVGMNQAGGKSGLGFFKKIGMSFTHPMNLFEETSQERAYPSLIYYLKLMIFPFIIMSFIGFVFSEALFGNINRILHSLAPALMEISLFELGAFVAFFIVLIIFGVIFFILVPMTLFLLSGILHLSAKLYRGRGDYSSTFRTIVYSSTLGILLFWVDFISFVGWIIEVALIIWISIIFIYGISINHQVSKLKAFFIMITPLILISGLIFLI